MKTKLLRALSLLLAVAMLMSLASCTSSCTKAKKKTPKKKTSQTTVNSDYTSDTASTGSVIDDNWDDDATVDSSEPEYGVIVASAEKDEDMKNGIASGKQLRYNDGDDKDDDDDPINDDDIDPIDEEDDFDPDNCEAIIPKYGSAIKRGNRTTERNITVHNNEVKFKHFDGVSCNCYPTYSTLYAQIKEDDNAAYLDLIYKRFNDTKPKYARCWWQIDWMVTDEAGEDYEKYASDVTKNPDYINYFNGVYWLDKSNEMMESCIDYWKMLEQAGTHVYVAFGWKIGTRLHSWMAEDISRPRTSAPINLDQYADAAEKLFLYCQDRGLKNVDVIAFYNEPQQVENANWRFSWDYTTVGDKRVYWANMVTKVYDKFKANPRLKNVKVASCDGSQGLNYTSDEYVSNYLKNKVPDKIDIHTEHCYPDTYVAMSPNKNDLYSPLFDLLVMTRYFFSPNEDGKNAYDFMITEMYAYAYDAGEQDGTTLQADDYAWSDRNSYWNVNTTAYYLACANTGCRSFFTWSMCGGTLLDPSSFNPANDYKSAFISPHDTDSAKNVRSYYYNFAFLNNYIPDDADVYSCDWTGNDYRVGAFTSADSKEFSLLIQKSYDTKRLTFNVTLDKSLGGKTLYVYKLINDLTIRNPQASIPTLYTKIDNVNSSFKYVERDGEVDEYADYIFTTIKPVKQVEVYNSDTGEQSVASDLSLSGSKSVKMNALLLDCDPGDTVEWNVNMYYNAPVAVKKGEEAPKISYYYTKFDITEHKSVKRHEISGADLGTLTQSGNQVEYTLPADAKVGDTISLRCTIKDNTPNNHSDDRYAVAIIKVVK